MGALSCVPVKKRFSQGSLAEKLVDYSRRSDLVLPPTDPCLVEPKLEDHLKLYCPVLSCQRANGMLDMQVWGGVTEHVKRRHSWGTRCTVVRKTQSVKIEFEVLPQMWNTSVFSQPAIIERKDKFAFFPVVYRNHRAQMWFFWMYCSADSQTLKGYKCKIRLRSCDSPRTEKTFSGPVLPLWLSADQVAEENASSRPGKLAEVLALKDEDVRKVICTCRKFNIKMSVDKSFWRHCL